MQKKSDNQEFKMISVKEGVYEIGYQGNGFSFE